MKFPSRLNTSAALVFGAALCASAPAQACNPIEFLFGGCRPQPVQQDRYAVDPEPVRHLEKKKRPTVVQDSSAYKQTALVAPAGVAVGSVAHFTDDTTLRNGDVVVTPTGFLVYRGRGNGASASSFAPLGSGKVELAKLERASRRSTTGDWSARSPLATTDRTAVVRTVQPAAQGPSISTPN